MTKAERLLQDQVIARTLEINRQIDLAEREAERQKDIATLRRLVELMAGRTRKRERDPAVLAWRYLTKVRGGTWHRGGYHVARLNYGPGVAFGGQWEKTPAKPLVVGVINVEGGER